MMYSTTIVSFELAIPERWPLDRAFDIYAQIYAHFLKKTPFSTIFYNFLKIAKSLYIKGFQTICGNVAMDYNVAKESPIDYSEYPKIPCKSTICRGFCFLRVLT